MSGPAWASADRLPTAYAVWCVLRLDAATAWTAKSMAAQVDGPAASVRYILPALVEVGYAAREWRGGATCHGGCWVYRVAHDPAPLVPRVVLSYGRARVELVEERAAREFLISRRPIRPRRERRATDRVCRATLRYGLRDAARLLGVAPERLAQRTRTRASIDADECRHLLRSITAEGRIVELLGTELSPLAEPVALDDTEPRDEQQQEAHGMGMTLEEITELARNYARAVDRLVEVSEEIREQQRHAVRQRLRGLKARAAEASAARAVLHDAIDASRERFAAPRTRATDGVKYGLRKQPGRVEVTDEARSIARIRERLPRLVRHADPVHGAAAARPAAPARQPQAGVDRRPRRGRRRRGGDLRRRDRPRQAG